MLRKYDTPYMADWFAISLRWIMLVGLIVSLGLGDKLELSISWPLGLLICMESGDDCAGRSECAYALSSSHQHFGGSCSGGSVFLDAGRFAMVPQFGLAYYRS